MWEKNQLPTQQKEELMAYSAKDLAKELGISPSTVSLVLNNKPGISQERRAQILQLAEERGLLTPERMKTATTNLGFVVFRRTGLHVSNSPFFSLLLNGASNTATEHGCNLVISQYDTMLPALEQRRHIQASQFAGLIFFATEAVEGDYEIMQSFGLPFVVVDNSLFSDMADTICINNDMGIRMAFNYLYELGHRNIGYLCSHSGIRSHAERLDVYRACMVEHGLPLRDNSIVPLTYLGNNLRAELEPYLNSPDFPTAFLADNDFVAFSVKECLMTSGLRVPQDVSIIGFDNRDFGALYHPTLTTIALPTDYFGKMAVELLFDRIAQPMRPPTLVYVGGTLIKRESTAAPAK